ncbi:hypothetical protein MTR67_020717 [Solanum verrucosum]|uniref:BHLH domain-containing protein n=1 Tax=Solanum verrucosum TaxID=315347 RepID=A0AAF0QR89_SOLVR|nr:transcription factor bHLH84-like [Solanum verrucosum]WMV27332.1 hypothetical protein MTR67_020717 [Solanum verrucosum]
MEHVGAFFDEEWESLSKLFSSTETADFMFQLQGDHGSLYPMNGSDNAGSSYGTDNPQVAFSQLSDEANNNFQYFSQESSITSCGSDHGMFFTNPSHEHLQHSNNIDDVNNQLLQVAINNNLPDEYQSIDFFDMDSKNLENLCIDQDFQADMTYKEEMVCDQLDNAGISPVSDKEMQLKRKSDKIAPENPKKKSRASQDAQKNTKKKAQPKRGKKNQKMTQINNEEGEEDTNNNADNQIAQSSSCCSSEDDSNELNGGTVSSNTKGKSRASRGTATDPQSLYARRRRERINERLRILQTLVPNGTKVDISTMLEEAVTYVKFLQLQIKLLSSDELWMYAPLAYHGMDIGIYQKMLPHLQ